MLQLYYNFGTLIDLQFAQSSVKPLLFQPSIFKIWKNKKNNKINKKQTKQQQKTTTTKKQRKKRIISLYE